MMDDFDGDFDEIAAEELFDEGDHDGLTGLTAGQAAPDFRALEGEDYIAELAKLRPFVEWLTGAYGLSRTIPPCWMLHERLVFELSALQAAREPSYDPEDSGLGAIGWHERLGVAITRFESGPGAVCSADLHTPDRAGTATNEDLWNGHVEKIRAAAARKLQ